MAEERVIMIRINPSAKTKQRIRVSDANMGGIIKQDGEKESRGAGNADVRAGESLGRGFECP
jgi:hypothetical protein